MVNKRLKAGIKKFHKSNPRIRFCLGTIALVTLSIMMLIIATFTQIKINFNIPESGIISYLKFEYIPQIPVVLFISAVLGECWGLLAVLLYILLGFCFLPIFALGGGFSYVFQYNFGYIFGYLFAVLLVAKELKNGNTLLNILFAVFYGVFIIHLICIIYLSIIAILRHDGVDFIRNMIYFQSFSKILYDIVFGFIAILVAKGCKKLLWIIMG